MENQMEAELKTGKTELFLVFVWGFGFPKIGSLSGVPRLRIIVFGDLYGVSPYYGITKTTYPKSPKARRLHIINPKP